MLPYATSPTLVCSAGGLTGDTVQINSNQTESSKIVMFAKNGETGEPGEKPPRSRVENQQTQPTDM